MRMDTAVVGTGHVGLVTAATLAALGHSVTATDLDRRKLDALARGSSPFYEPGLTELIRRHVGDGRLRPVPELAQAVRAARVVFVCVGTPPRADGAANLAAVERVARDLARHVQPRAVVVEKSTVPAGTAERVRQVMTRERAGRGVDVVSNPEFLREGSAVADALRPSRILVGADSPSAFEAMRQVYAPLIEQGVPYIETDVQTAEVAKHACNAFLALKVSFANALARVCERAGGDVKMVADVMGSDPRIGRAFLDAGLGYGGYCFPKDLKAFERLCAALGYRFGLLEEVARLNDEALEAVVAKVLDAVWNVEGKRVALLGLSYKPGTDDVRFSPAVELARRLLALGADVVGHDPVANAAASAELPDLTVTDDPYEAVREARCLVVCTAWEGFRGLEFARVRALMAEPTVVDARNLFDPETMRRAGFAYHPTGRPAVLPVGVG